MLHDVREVAHSLPHKETRYEYIALWLAIVVHRNSYYDFLQ